MDIREQMDSIYRDLPLENIPWNMSEPPQLMVEAVKDGAIHGGPIVDLGCGAGNHSVWLAKQGFDVTGLDISEEAIKHAEDLARSNRVSCRFFARDLLGDLTEFHGSFCGAIDWEVLHHIFPDDRAKFVRNVHDLLRPKGAYLSVCFSEKDAAFGGEGKFRETPLGTTLYFSSENELRELFEPLFKILELGTVEIAGKHGPHLANVAWLERK
jgi:2-polyprenyl-3-methyl-5-hydroxy-6-metoxy-1,4-benzoquinol methylase